MGINDLLPHVPGGRSNDYHHSFYDLGLEGSLVPLNAVGPLSQFVAHHAADYIHGNHTPALIEWGRFLNYHRSICKWKFVAYFDGRINPHNDHENQRREQTVSNNMSSNNLRGQVRNTPDCNAKAAEVCKFLNIEFYMSAFEADPQVSALALNHSLVPMCPATRIFWRTERIRQCMNGKKGKRISSTVWGKSCLSKTTGWSDIGSST